MKKTAYISFNQVSLLTLAVHITQPNSTWGKMTCFAHLWPLFLVTFSTFYYFVIFFVWQFIISKRWLSKYFKQPREMVCAFVFFSWYVSVCMRKTLIIFASQIRVLKNYDAKWKRVNEQTQHIALLIGHTSIPRE